jgi:hypothetical protein
MDFKNRKSDLLWMYNYKRIRLIYFQELGMEIVKSIAT